MNKILYQEKLENLERKFKTFVKYFGNMNVHSTGFNGKDYSELKTCLECDKLIADSYLELKCIECLK